MNLPNKMKTLIYFRRNTLVTRGWGGGGDLPSLTALTHLTLLTSSQLAHQWGLELPAGWFGPTPHCLEDSCAGRIPSLHLDKASLTTSQQPKPVCLHTWWPFCCIFTKWNTSSPLTYFELWDARGLSRVRGGPRWRLHAAPEEIREAPLLFSKQRTHWRHQGHWRTCHWPKTMPCPQSPPQVQPGLKQGDTHSYITYVLIEDVIRRKRRKWRFFFLP